MESFIISAVVLAVICAYQYYREVQEKKEAEEDSYFKKLMEGNNDNDNQNSKDVQMMGTKDFFIDLLQKMGCQFEVDETNRINFKWQGGYFTADADNESSFVIVWYIHWAEYELYDIDTISKVKRVINDANIHFNINVIYSANEAGSTFNVHSKKHFLLMSQIPDAESYLNAILSMFFEVRRYVETQIDKLKIEEERTNNN